MMKMTKLNSEICMVQPVKYKITINRYTYVHMDNAYVPECNK